MGFEGSGHTAVPTLSEELLREGISQSLRAHLSANAIFLSERLCISHSSPNASHLLATAHLQAGNFSRAAEALHPATTPANRYLYALACFKIGTPDRLREAEEHLRAPHAGAVPGGAAGQYLLGAICQRTSRRDAAVDHYLRALRANPTLWVAFEALAGLGLGPTNVDAVFAHATDMSARGLLRAQPFATPQPTTAPAARPPIHAPTSPECPPTVTAPSRRRLRGLNSSRNVSTPADPSPLISGPMQFETPAGGSFVTPSPMAGTTRTRAGEFSEDQPAPHGPLRGNLGGLRRAPRAGISHSPSAPLDVPAKLFGTPTGPEVSSQTPRKKSSLRRKLGDAGTAAQETEELRLASRPAAPTFGAMDVVKALGKITAALGRYQCALAHSLLDTLPAPHSGSAFAYAARARARFEDGDFQGACTEYARALAADPNCMDAIVERYSTALWHQKKLVALAQLAARAQRMYPVTSAGWVAVGNCYSLQRDADGALRYFRKATRLDPRNAYAHTLMGHELSVKEDFDGALAAFRSAIHVDERHYNALYGIAQVLQKQEKYLLSERHFRAALNIHPQNSFLHYHLGLALGARASHDFAKANARAQANHALAPPPADLMPALEELETACKLNPKNPVAAFERAKILITIGRLHDAREQLVKLKDVMPKEAEVHYEIARLDRLLGDLKGAVRGIVVALDLDPKERKYKKELELLNLQTSEFYFGDNANKSM